jgi:hypothetical protein
VSAPVLGRAGALHRRDLAAGPARHPGPQPLVDTTDLHDEDFAAVLADHLPEAPAAPTDR